MPKPPPRPPETTLVRESLLAWYRRHRRDLPWRRDTAPYRVLLSELMCQQTRVDTAIPYFERFTARWPTLAHLAGAHEDEVMKEWAGLGYYSRARNLLACARAAHAMGGLPDTAERLRELPGVGPYTAGAVASIAFGEATPAVDGNVNRVLSRLDGLDADPRSTEGKRALWQRAGELVPPQAPGDFNQALMELGALVCTPRKPRCGDCPLVAVCVARASGREHELPTKTPRRKPVPIRGVAGLLVEDGRVLLAKRPGVGLLPNLWEPPGGTIAAQADGCDELVRVIWERAGLAVLPGPHLRTVVHVFSHRKLTLDVWSVTRVNDPALVCEPGYYQEVRWVDAAAPDVALSTLAKKMLGLS